MKYWLRHLGWWARQVLEFPFRQDHTWTKAVGDKIEWCLICAKEQLDPYFNQEEEDRLIKKYSLRDELTEVEKE